MATVLVCDDEAGVRFMLREALEASGYAVIEADGADAAMRELDRADVLLTDLVMPGRDGMALLGAALAWRSALPVVMLTAQGTTRTAVEAMRSGAYDWLEKPCSLDELRAVIARAAEASALRDAARRHSLERATSRAVVGDSAVFRRLLDDATRVARREVPVLVTGETGTGKELIASLLHACSPRAGRPCVRFNCAALPEELAEAELFGHTRGAFTGAHQARRGFFQQADGGTLVLDEVGELPRAVQAKLLRALQEGEVQPVGASRCERVDVRVVACTHRPLRAEVERGAFRDDLYWRLAVVELTVPPLRDRRDDIPALADAFRRRYALRFGLDGVSFSPALMKALSDAPWPGNVRELENTVARLLALSEGGAIGVDALRPEAQTARPAESAPAPEGGDLRVAVAGFERSLLEKTLQATRGNHSEAARRLGVTRVTLLDKLKRHGLRGG